MAIENVAGQLARIPIFADLQPQQINRIARRAERCRFRDGDAITRAGMCGDAAYLIVSGGVHSLPRVGSNALPEAIAPGSLVGELAMLVEHTYGVTVLAEGPVNCLRLARATLHEQMRADPDIAERLAHVIRERLELTASQLRRIDQLLMRSVSVALPRARPPLALPDAASVHSPACGQ
jgi:CRP-like cAMP-binding protein